jgi:hypothetical protein
MNINEQNMASFMLMEALLGAISPNFRMVAISFSRDTWKVGFWLEKEDEIDREEIEDALGEFDSLVLGMENPPLKISAVTEISGGSLPRLDVSDWRTIFLRRE